MRFDDSCQTGTDLIENYVKKVTKDGEVGTEPVKILKDQKIACSSVQTDVNLDGLYREVDEPVTLPLPEGKHDKSGSHVQNLPRAEKMPGVRPRTPPPKEELRDWADSPLWKFVQESHLR